jgi:hypothetical protein
MRNIAILLLSFLAVSTVQAQVYKCTNESGNVTFSSMPCGGGGEIVEGLEGGSSGIESAGSGPPSSMTLADGNILNFKKIVSIQVRTPLGYQTGREGMHVYYEGTDHLVKFENLVSMTVLTWDRNGCGNLSHLCNPMVQIKTKAKEITARYEALRNVKVQIDDELDGTEKEMTIWFANKNRPHIRSIRF